ncbi:MAG: nucleotidyltransferase domain-containing protein [Candidatus Kapabacteria bacterium]|nr:nucleotidyltransferase domain-containing protein [Candidatus Kapabacteria bacterium]
MKKQLLAEGFVIEGVFGSFRRDESDTNSDIDILYDLDNVFRDKYKGFKAVARLDAIQEYISLILGIQADLVQKKYLGTVSAKYILPEVYYVD